MSIMEEMCVCVCAGTAEMNMESPVVMTILHSRIQTCYLISSIAAAGQQSLPLARLPGPAIESSTPSLLSVWPQ